MEDNTQKYFEGGVRHLTCLQDSFMRENVATVSKVTGSQPLFQISKTSLLNNTKRIGKRQLQRKSSSLCFIFNSPDIVQGFTFVILLASLGVYIKLDPASLSQLPTPWAYLAAKRSEKYWGLITTAKG